METYLKEINSVLGVVGSFVCLSDGSIGAKALPDEFDAASIEAAARVATQTLYALETSGQRITETDLVYGRGRLLLKSLRGGILAIICTRSINIPLLNLTANGIARKLSSELKPAKTGTVAAMPPSTAAQSTGSSLSIEEITPPPVDHSMVGPAAPPELADDKFFVELTRELTRVMGPVSSIILEDEIDELKEKREAFPKTRTAELVARLGMVIHDEAKRAKFLLVMSEIMQRS
jgi:predicted regulator of Ras-like GTPase activity (Roadblock/LC7/MglB family)